jgi:PhnB protein
MTKKVSAIPEGYSSVTPYITISGAADALAFYKKAFGAEEVMCMKRAPTARSCTPRSASAAR